MGDTQEKQKKQAPPQFLVDDEAELLSSIGKEKSMAALKEMVRIRQFETRAEASYLQGKIGGFFHSYIGQEAIQTGAIFALSKNNWFITSYRCHALALLLGENENSLMAELFGKATGNALGRGGSMHMYSKRLLGGFGIVGGQIPIATGAAFSLKYQEKKEELAICFFGDGAVPQGAFHESLNMASIMSLPCMYIIENNQWSMGTPLIRTLANYTYFAKHVADAYGIRYFRVDGMDFCNTYAAFSEAKAHMLNTGRPVLIECIAERFKGHSISDPGLYRTKEELKLCMEKDPILIFKEKLKAHDFLTEEEYKEIEKNARLEAVEAVAFAEESPWPALSELEQDVFAPEQIMKE